MYTDLQTRRLPGQLYAHGLMGFGLGDDSSNDSDSGISVPIAPIISAAAQVATVALSSWLTDKKANAMNKTYSTTIVNDLEPLLRANVQAYLAGPGTCADQAACLSAFDSAWQWLQSSQACGNPQLGTPGQNCINDRAPGGKWDWTAYYRTPIANDPRAAGCSTVQGTTIAAATNVLNKITGSNVMTNSGLVDPVTGTATTGTTGVAATTDPLTALTQTTIAGIPLLYLAGGALLLVLAMK